MGYSVEYRSDRRFTMKGGLVYVSDADPGISRRRYGKGFRYFDPSSHVIKSEAEIARITQLAVPPAYKEVWICARSNGHIQATGFDDAGRKQYRYHAEWTSFRGTAKFDRLADFGHSLPRIRRKVEAILANAKSGDIFGKDVATAALEALRISAAPTIKLACEAAAEVLCNTPAIARKSYVHPSILKLAQERTFAREMSSRQANLKGLTAPENRLAAILK